MAKRDIQRTIGLRAARNRVLRFGMVAVGIGTGPALDTSARVSGKLYAPDGGAVKQVYEADDGTIYQRGDLITRYEYEGKLVELAKDEVAFDEGDGSVELIARLRPDEVPSEWVQSTSLAWPNETAMDEAYMLLASFLRGTGDVLIGRVADGGTTKVLAIRWSNVYGCVIQQTLAYHAQVRHANVQAIQDGMAKMADPSDEMIALADKLFAAIPDDFAWDEVRDTYGERMAEAIREKAETGAVAATVAKASGPAPGTPDLLATLKASLEGVAA